MNSVEIREQLVNSLRLDLVGPAKGSELEEEVLQQAPSRWYLAGFLVPLEADEEQRSDETSGEKVEALDDAGGTDDAETPESTAARRVFFPSSMGMSLLVPEEAKEAKVIVRWGDYRQERHTTGSESAGDGGESGGEVSGEDPVEGEIASGENTEGEATTGPGTGKRPATVWKRTQREELVDIPLPNMTSQPAEHEVPKSGGLKLVISVRPVSTSGMGDGLIPSGTRSVSIFLVNKRRPAPDIVQDEGFVFQAELDVYTDTPLVPRPNLRGLETDDWDEKVADLQYRDIFEYAVGHGIATEAETDPDKHCRNVRTRWIPSAQVERVAPAPIQEVELSMEALADIKSGIEGRERLSGIVTQYLTWIDNQRKDMPTDPPNRRETAEELLRRAKIAAARIESGIALLDDPQVLEAFRTANRAMAVAARQRFGVMQGKDPGSIDPPSWWPFQLAFLLMNLPGIVDPQNSDREVVDLLFFPTGGGKTEAYLGLAAFTLVLRRLRNPGISSAGLSVLMRYTLRLLTLDQLSRAATLICALELERQNDVSKFGDWPFEIGLWVGLAATPNRMGGKGDVDPRSARKKNHRLHERRSEAITNSSGGMPLVRDQIQADLFPASPQS